MSKYLVTGGAGFIGSHIVERLVSRNEEVIVLDDFSTGRLENLKNVIDRITLIKGDIRDKDLLRRTMEGVDFVIHQAAMRSVPQSVKDPISTENVNVMGTILLLELARQLRVKKVIFASSSSVYGESSNLPYRENSPTSPISPYAVSKLCGEYYCSMYSSLYGIETVCLRYFNVFGPRQDITSEYAAVIPKFIDAYLKGKPLDIYGDGLQSRDFSYIDNVVDATLLCVEKPLSGCEVFNVGCGKSYTILELADMIGKILNKKVEYKFKSPRSGDVRHTLSDISKAKRLLGYEVKVDFMEGLKRTIDHFSKWRK